MIPPQLRSRGLGRVCCWHSQVQARTLRGCSVPENERLTLTVWVHQTQSESKGHRLLSQVSRLCPGKASAPQSYEPHPPRQSNRNDSLSPLSPPAPAPHLGGEDVALGPVDADRDLGAGGAQLLEEAAIGADPQVVLRDLHLQRRAWAGPASGRRGGARLPGRAWHTDAKGALQVTLWTDRSHFYRWTNNPTTIAPLIKYLPDIYHVPCCVLIAGDANKNKLFSKLICPARERGTCNNEYVLSHSVVSNSLRPHGL